MSPWILVSYIIAPFGIHFNHGSLSEGSQLQFLLYTIFINGFIEEFFKFILFFFVALRFRSFEKNTGGIIYASTIALGFASFENIGYLPHLQGLELFGRAVWECPELPFRVTPIFIWD